MTEVRLHSIAVRNLRRRKARAAFLVVGLLIGVATVVALLSLTRSMTGEARDQPARASAPTSSITPQTATWR